MVNTSKEGILPEYDVEKTGLINPLFCGKHCYNKFVSDIKNLQKKKEKEDELNLSRWHNDGKTPTVNSMQVLINWLTDEANYTNYRGGKVNGQTDGKSKMAFCGDISNEIVNKGMLLTIFIILLLQFLMNIILTLLELILLLVGLGVVRSNDSIRKKITNLEAQYRKASDWLNNTGAGVTDEETLKSIILKMCPYYYELDPVMKDRPSSFAAWTNEMSDGNESLATLDSDDEDAVQVNSNVDDNVEEASLEKNTQMLDALKKIDSTNTEVCSSTSTTPLTKHNSVVTPLLPSTKFSNSSDEQEAKNENNTNKCDIDIRRETPLRKKQHNNRAKKRTKKSIRTIADTKTKRTVEVMPPAVALYYEERSSSLKSKDQRSAEKHSIEMKCEKFKLMMELINNNVAEDLEDAKKKINSNLFE